MSILLLHPFVERTQGSLSVSPSSSQTYIRFHLSGTLITSKSKSQGTNMMKVLRPGTITPVCKNILNVFIS